LRITRSGYFRVAVRLPASTEIASLDSIIVRCYATEKPAVERLSSGVRLSKVFMLDSNYVPRELHFNERSPVKLKPGEEVAFSAEFGPR